MPGILVRGPTYFQCRRDGAVVVRRQERDVRPVARDPERERQLWDATATLLAAVG